MVIYNHKQQLIGVKWLLQRPSFTVMEKWQYYNNKQLMIHSDCLLNYDQNRSSTFVVSTLDPAVVSAQC